MISNRREFNKQETISHIRRVFLELFAQNGIGGITVSGLCKASGIAKSTFYLYYDDKYAVLEAIERELLEGTHAINPTLLDCDMDDVRRGKPVQQAYDTILFINEHLTEYKALLGRNGDPHFVYKWKKNIAESFLGRFEEEQGDARAADIACTIFSSALVGLFTYFIFDMPDVTERDFSIIIGNLFKYALLDFQSFAT